MSDPQPDPAAPSSFVTTLAWIFIVLSSGAVFIAGVQNIAAFLLFSGDQFDQLFGRLKIQQLLPPLAQFLIIHVRWIFAGFFVMSTATFVAAVGLLQRASWGRIAFITLMGLGIAWCFGIVAVQYTVLSVMMPPIADGAPDEFQSHWEWIRLLAMTFSITMAILFSTLFGWIIRRLLSPAVREEFRQRPTPVHFRTDE